ncbi:GtrA family protein [Vibrio salinus]|uniref:GtrA family protein n=1 Tax=Vibrio salinus TaxID=2899784 RepID=UPI001E488A5A|nr:GtrA family protein [Vibrio salinus]MCE0494825.1 GtrA family protein [Vibrio salinus]
MQNIVKLLNAYFSAELLQKLRFSVVGVINTVVAYLSFVILLYLLKYYLIASVLSSFIGMMVSFILNRRFVFRAAARKGQFIPFCVVNLVSISCSAGAVYIFVDVLNIYVYLAQAMSIGVSMVINYLGYRAVFTYGMEVK